MLEGHFIFYRPGEIELFLRPKNIDGEPIELPDTARQTIEELVERAGSKVTGSRGARRVRRTPWQDNKNRQHNPEPVADVLNIRLQTYREDLDPSTAEGEEAVRTAVLDVKTVTDFMNQRAGMDLDTHTLIATGPNWLIAPECACPCPGGLPLVSNVDRRFPRGEVAALVRTTIGANQQTAVNQGAGVLVAVFDTWPTRADDPIGRIKDRYDDVKKRFPAKNPWGLESASNQGPSPLNANITNRVESRWPETFSTRVDCQGEVGQPYALADHGLFCAHVIHDIAPQATVIVYRCLDDYGLDDFHTLVLAVEDAIEEAKRRDMPLVLNMSLGFGPHPTMLDKVLEYPLTYFDVREHFGQDAAPAMRQGRSTAVEIEMKQRDRKEMLAVTHLFSLGGEPGVLAVAAAGNDSCGDGQRAGPRFPANVEGVVGVSAISDPHGRLSDFSNLDDIANTPDDGISAFGGEVNDPYGGPPVTTRGVVGPYSDERIPLGAGPRNDSGWAEWAGTSFSTPIVAAFAASLWSQNPWSSTLGGYRSDQILQFIVTKPGGGARAYIPLFQR